jgi:hypothetical protein
MERWLERLGYASQWVADTLREASAGVQERGEQLRDEADEQLPALSPQLLATAAGAAGTLLASRLLRAERVHWPRAVAAGVVGTLLYDAVAAVDQRLLGRKLDATSEAASHLTDDPEAQRWAAVAARYAAGVGLAVFYARYVHHRVPGPPALRGALFGGLDATTLKWGGLMPLLSRAMPEADLPAGLSALSDDPALGASTLARHVAWGVGVGAVYGEG